MKLQILLRDWVLIFTFPQAANEIVSAADYALPVEAGV